MERQNIGKYEIRGVLGRGHTGTVYDGWDPVIRRRVAIKTMALPDASTEEGQDQLERFRREAHVSGRLSHPNIIAVHDYGETDDTAYIVMEYIDGKDPVTFLRQQRTSSAEAVRIIRDVLTALQFSHEHGVVHRDIKPGNVMVTANGHVKIGDFGIARTEDSRLTQFGTQIGTPAYMSPEQLTGEPADARSDIYSTGVVLYQLLAGEKPFDGSLTSIIHKVLHTRPPRPSALSLLAPPALDAIVERAMARRPADRFSNAAEFSAALAGANLEQGSLPAEIPSPAPADSITNVVSPRATPPDTRGTVATETAPAKASMAPALKSAGALLIVAVVAGSAYLAANRPAAVTQPVQPTGLPPAAPAAFPPAPASPTPATSSPKPASPKPEAEPVLGPPRDNKTLAEAIMAFVPAEKQAGQRDNVDRYVTSKLLHRSLGVSAAGLTWWAGPFGATREAANEVLEGCEVFYNEPCGTAAVDDTVLQGSLTRRPMPRVAYSGPFDPAQIPTVRPPRLLEADVARYGAAASFKAMALHPTGRLFTATEKSTQQAANDAALAACAEDPDRRGHDGPCYLYAEANTVVLTRHVARAPRPPAEVLGPDALLERLTSAFPQVPNLRTEARTFLALGLNRALAINPQTGYIDWWVRRPTLAETESGILELCELNSGSPCRIAIANNEIRDAAAPLINQPRVAYAGPFDPLQIPAITLLERSSAYVTEYASAPGAKAMAIHPAGRVYTAVGRDSQAAADDAALDACSRAGGAEPCYLYASGNRVVLAARQTRATPGQAAACPMRRRPG